jgi:hypothetical protein
MPTVGCPCTFDRSRVTYLVGMRSALEWFIGLNVGQKVLAVLFGGLLLFSVAYLITGGVLWLLFADQEESSQVDAGDPREEASVPDQDVAAPPAMGLQITRADWAGDAVEVEGRWGGEISSVHCDLFEGSEQRVVDWWDRSVSPSMAWPDHTFKLVFVEADQREVDDSIDPSVRYTVTCLGTYSNGWSTSASALVEGKPSS